MHHVALLGTGLIGGSIGLGLRAAMPEITIAGYDLDAGSLERAIARGAVTDASADPSAVAHGADIVVLAVPLDQLEPTLKALDGGVGPDAVVTDVGSAKAAAVALGEATYGDRFVGGHPMSGSERHGIEAADGDLFQDASWILTPTPRTSSGAYTAAARLAGALGARVVALDPQTHDDLVARLSHLPQLVASAIVDVAAGAGDKEALLGLAGGGFRDVTRIAASDPRLWVSIIRTNRDAVTAALESLGASLGSVAELIGEGRWDELAEWLTNARTARLELFAKPVPTGEPVALSLMIPDRPGVLAEVTTEAGRLGANIEDLRIVHSTEGGRGRLELVVAGAPAADALSAALTAIGYHVDHPDINFST
jgi:prephenate dehydrogenase